MASSTFSTASLLTSNLFSVAGRRILITGGGSGLGSYAAIGLALNGAKVYIVGRRKEKLEGVKKDFEARAASEGSQNTGEIVILPGDVSVKEGIAKLVEDYSKLETHLDVLINGAGVLGNKLNITGAEKNDSECSAQTGAGNVRIARGANCG